MGALGNVGESKFVTASCLNLIVEETRIDCVCNVFKITHIYNDSFAFCISFTLKMYFVFAVKILFTIFSNIETRTKSPCK